MENQKAIASGGVIEEKDGMMERDKLEIRIANLLDDMGISVGLDAYNYLKTAILLFMEDNGYVGEICEKLYPEVAKIYNVADPMNVEKAIRYGIEVVWKKGNIELLHEIFSHTVSYAKGKPTNVEFIATIVEKLKLERDEVSELERKVAKLLFEFGISPKLKGYFYLKSAILLELEDTSYQNSIMCALYIDVAKIYGTTWKKIERSIYNALKISWERGNISIIKEFFPEIFEYQAIPNNSRFIKNLVNKIKYGFY